MNVLAFTWAYDKKCVSRDIYCRPPYTTNRKAAKAWEFIENKNRKIIFVSAFAREKKKEIQMNRCYWEWIRVKTRKMHSDATI